MFRSPLRDDADLRLLELRHASELFASIDCNRARLKPWLSWVDATRSTADTRSFIQAALKQFAEGSGFHAGIFVNNKIVGGIGLHDIDWPNRKSSLGYWVAETHEGKGLVTESVRAVVAFTFLELALNRLEIRCAIGNQRSRRVAIRSGFNEEGIRRQYEHCQGQFRDLIVYYALAEEWTTHRNAL
jgi:ribosomal-protein-serine acetyltransferase